MPKIRSVHAREVLDSRGNPTVEVDVFCDDGAHGRAIVPSGASTGRHEAVELRDHDPARYGGQGVLKAVANVCETLGPEIIGVNIEDQPTIDRRMIELDGTPNKSRLGANAILGISLACSHAAAATRGVALFEHLAVLWGESWQRAGIGSPPSAVRGPRLAAGSGQTASSGQYSVLSTQYSVPTTSKLNVVAKPEDSLRTPHSALRISSPSLPLPMVNMISGGLHAGGNLDFQDFLIMPVGAGSYREALNWIVSVYRSLGHVLARAGYESVLVGDEGGYGPRLNSNSKAVELLVDAITGASLVPGRDVAIALDVASSHFYASGHYRLATSLDHEEVSAAGMVEMLSQWVDDFPIVSIEDGCAEDDWDGWRQLTERLGGRVQIVGDDLFVTNPARLARGIESNVANAILIKPNQIGTLTETLDVIAQAKAAGYGTVISARSGETEDTTIAHVAVATAAGQIKIGSVARSERLAKYNELLRIEDQLGDRACYEGRQPFGPWRE